MFTAFWSNAFYILVVLVVAFAFYGCACAAAPSNSSRRNWQRGTGTALASSRSSHPPTVAVNFIVVARLGSLPRPSQHLQHVWQQTCQLTGFMTDFLKRELKRFRKKNS